MSGTVYELAVNGTPRRVEGAHVGDSLLHVLRDRLGLPGAKNACEQGECGSCSVLVDGELVCSCLELAEAAAGCAVTHRRGLDPRRRARRRRAVRDVLTDVQQAMVEAGGVQCGFCTPGFVVAIHDLLDRVSRPGPLEVREALAGNLCRCTGYGRILDAVGRSWPSARRRPSPRPATTAATRDRPPDPAHDRGGPADGRIGDSPVRPDGTPKVQGRVRLRVRPDAEGMLWGRTLRSPHPHARITSSTSGRPSPSPAWPASSPPTTCPAPRPTG